MVVTTDSAEQTERIGADLAAELHVGHVVRVIGPLGAGKTTLIRGACEALGVSDRVQSPTFTIGRRYDGPVPVAHLDLYRLEGGLGDEDPALLADYLDRRTITFVEWPELAEGDLPGEGPTVRIEMLDGDRRRIEVAW